MLECCSGCIILKCLKGYFSKAKMAKLDLYENWVEILAFILLVLGFFMATSLSSAVVSYFIILLCGATSGRVLFKLKKTLKFPWMLITVGFLIGFVFGSFYGNRIVIAVLYVIGIIGSYYAHEKKFIK